VGLVLLEDPYWLEHLYYVNTIGYGFVAILQPLGAMAAIAALHALQGRRYGTWGAYSAAMAFVGLALAVGALAVGVVALSYPSELLALLILVGLLVASVGMVLVGGLTVAGGVLPPWCGVAIMGGSPFGMFVMMAPSMLFRGWPEGILWLAETLAALGGVVWILVGYSIFRAAGSRIERSSQAR
jgi:hypothetical protein